MARGDALNTAMLEGLRRRMERHQRVIDRNLVELNREAWRVPVDASEADCVVVEREGTDG